MLSSSTSLTISPFTHKNVTSKSSLSPSSTPLLPTHFPSRPLKTRHMPHLNFRASVIEKERSETHRPDTFLRNSDTPNNSSVRSKFEKMIREAQDSVCKAIQESDGGAEFKEDVWSRPGGGGGISRVLQDGNVFEKAGVNVSVVYGVMPPEAYRAANPTDVSFEHKPGPVPFFAAGISSAQDTVCIAILESNGGAEYEEDVWSRSGGGGEISRVLQDGNVFEKAGVNVSVVYGVMPPEAYRAANPTDVSFEHKPGLVPFFAAGISSVLHPKNPFAPTLHFNYRYFETDAPKDAPGAPRQWWFGGGTDLTPAYIFEEDVKHFHSIQKEACDKFDSSFYPRFKKWCDDYFYIKHRDERRGLGGIFFDDLNDYDQEMLLSFATECANSVVPAYVPIIEKRKDTPFTDQHKAWQQLRRGRYVEFNLVYDRGTTFGLKTGGRIESILVSLPLSARWEYDHKPEEGTEEWKLLDACINPKEWI